MEVFVLVLLIWVLLCSIINTIIAVCFDYSFNHPIKIKLPKNKKYVGKVNPIYRVVECLDGYAVEKYELGYNEKFLFIFLMFCLFPYPVKLYFYGYVQGNYLVEITLENNDSISTLNKPIEEIYEKKMEKIEKNNKEIIKRQTDDENKIKELNKTFNENYK